MINDVLFEQRAHLKVIGTQGRLMTSAQQVMYIIAANNIAGARPRKINGIAVAHLLDAARNIIAFNPVVSGVKIRVKLLPWLFAGGIGPPPNA